MHRSLRDLLPILHNFHQTHHTKTRHTHTHSCQSDVDIAVPLSSAQKEVIDSILHSGSTMGEGERGEERGRGVDDRGR